MSVPCRLRLVLETVAAMHHDVTCNNRQFCNIQLCVIRHVSTPSVAPTTSGVLCVNVGFTPISSMRNLRDSASIRTTFASIQRLHAPFMTHDDQLQFVV